MSNTFWGASFIAIIFATVMTISYMFGAINMQAHMANVEKHYDILAANTDAVSLLDAEMKYRKVEGRR